jgi:microcompartment protein CcmL/EutN
MTRASSSGPALAMLDVADVPTGLLALDMLAKEALVEVLNAGTVQSGRYLLLFAGAVEPVEMSFAKAERAAGPSLCDAMLLPWADERIFAAVCADKRRWPAPGDTLGVVQNGTSPTLLRAVDAALKGAVVDLVELRVGDGLNGKAIATLWGETHDVEAALELAQNSARSGRADGWSQVVIRNADAAVRKSLSSSTRFFSEWRG